MNSAWPKVTFDDAPLQIIDGDRGSNYPKQEEFHDEGHCLFLNTGNVTKSGFHFENCQFITEQKDGLLRKGKLSREDVIMTTRGTIGNVGYFNRNVPFEHIRINSGMVIFRANREKLLPSFLYQYLRSEQFNKQVNSLRSGAAQPQLPIRDIKVIKLPLPSVDQQEAISELISKYDDLIENNKRRIELLEESARQLYKEWFVRFRFPGHEHVAVTDGVPEGWEKTVLGAVSITNDLSHKAKELPEEVNYIDISAVSTGRIETKNRMFAEDAPGRARRIAKHGDVIWSNVRPNLKAYALVLHPDENDVFSTGFTTISGTRIPYSFLYSFTTTDSFVKHLVNHTTGSSYPAVRPPDFEKAELLLPPQTLLEQFHAICEPSFELAFILGVQTKQLAEARDLLLPKLMSGEIVV